MVERLCLRSVYVENGEYGAFGSSSWRRGGVEESGLYPLEHEAIRSGEWDGRV